MIWLSLATWFGVATVIISVLAVILRLSNYIVHAAKGIPASVSLYPEYVGIILGCLLIGLTQ